jgi:hypothetical protein
MPRLKIKYIKIHRATGVSPWVSTNSQSYIKKIMKTILVSLVSDQTIPNILAIHHIKPGLDLMGQRPILYHA